MCTVKQRTDNEYFIQGQVMRREQYLDWGCQSHSKSLSAIKINWEIFFLDFLLCNSYLFEIKLSFADFFSPTKCDPIVLSLEIYSVKRQMNIVLGSNSFSTFC